MSRRIDYDEGQSLREARTAYFRANGFGEDGGYSAAWVGVRLGRIPFAFPNTQARVRAVRFHDLHHVVTGYATDLVGEAEIAAWEIASGCAGFAAAWVLNLHAWMLGLVVDPAATLRAFAPGRRPRTPYRRAWGDALLAERVGDVRRELGLSASGADEAAEPTLVDRIGFAGWSLAAALFSAASLALLVAPLWLLLRALA